MNQEIIKLKIGIVSLLGFILFVYLIFFLQDRDFYVYHVNVGFSDVQLLMKDAKVNLAGVKIGKVRKMIINLNPTLSKKVIVTLEINKNYRIPKDSEISIASSGMFGTNYIKIVPPEEVPKDGFTYLAFESTKVLQGYSSANFDQLMTQGKESLTKLNFLLDNVNQVTGDKNLKDDIRNIVHNLKNTSSQMNDFILSIRTDFKDISKDIVKITKNLNAALSTNTKHFTTISKNIADITTSNKSKINSILEKIELISDSVYDNGELKTSLKQMRENFVKISDNVEVISNKAKDIITNPKFETSLNDAIDSATSAAKSLTTIKTNLDSIQTDFTSQVLYSTDNKDVQANFYSETKLNDKHLLKVGLEDVDNLNGISTLQAGVKKGPFTYRAGLQDKKFGASIERQIMNENASIGLEAWGTGKTSGRVWGKVKVDTDTDILLRVDKINKKNKEFLMGVSRDF
ncbi:MAG: MCE family protein [Candidatus Cloacimonetes bacterium]|nr:MCE family protein [Candidatus Cloacimonadota bacterium]